MNHFTIPVTHSIEHEYHIILVNHSQIFINSNLKEYLCDEHLNEEHLWFAGECWTLVSCEVTPEVLWLVGVVTRIQDTQLAVGQH